MALVRHSRGLMDLCDVVVRHGDRNWKTEVDNLRADWGVCSMYMDVGFDVPALPTRFSMTFAVGEPVLVVSPAEGGGHHLAWGVLKEQLKEDSRQPYDRSVGWLISIPAHGPADHALAFDMDGRIAGAIEAIEPGREFGALLPSERLSGLVPRNFAEFLITVGAAGQVAEQYRTQPEVFDDAASLCVAGNALQSVGKLDEAIEAWGRAAKLDAKNPWPLQATGDALAKLGRVAEANQAYARARELGQPA
jgi:tetratricopeptide (TPR) repeat protein